MIPGIPRNPGPEPEPGGPPAPPARPAAIGRRLALACLLLVIAGGARFWQERRIEAHVSSGLTAPFPLRDLPMQIGDWQGRDEDLDPYIARGTGSVDNIRRVYSNRRTGARLEVIVLYGPASAMMWHAPEVCYPAAGFRPGGDVLHYEIPAAREGAPPGRFRSLVYARGEGGQAEIQEVDYAWRYQGRWTPETRSRQASDRIPAMFKAHVARVLTPGELRGAANPNREFVARLIPEIERRLDETRSPVAAAPGPPGPAVDGRPTRLR